MPAEPTIRKRTTKAAAAKVPLDPKALLKQAALPTKTVPFCTRPDLQEEFEALAVEHAKLAQQRKEHHGLAAPVDLEAAIVESDAAIDALLERMREHTVVFRFRAVSKAEHKKALVSNPPRKGNEVDEKLGYNLDAVETFYVRTGCVEPDMSTEDWDELEPVLTPYVWEQFVSACNGLAHSEATSVPFLSAAL